MTAPTLRRVFFTSQKRIQSFTGRPNCGLISITDPGAPPVKLKTGWGAILRIAFRDIDPITFPQFPGNEGLFTVEQAHAIARFIEALPEAIDTLVIHCTAGISRSGGVAKSVAFAKSVYFPQDYKEYNQYVYATLLKALMEG